MARTKNQKNELKSFYAEQIKKAKAIYILEPNGLTANQAVEIKKAMYDLDSSYNVVKNSIFKLALKEAGMEIPKELDAGPKSIVFTGDKLTDTAKVISVFMKDKANTDKLTIKSGILDGKLISGLDIQNLADLPSRDVLIAQVLGTMNGPISGFVNVLSGTIRQFINVVNEIKTQKA